jgi:diguanylate cyclase (GGDEF)-like protein/PAS domain S-box-containing protein
MPGVEYNANVLRAVLDKAWIEPLHPAWRGIATVVLVLLPLLAYRRLSAHGALLVLVLALVGTVVFALALMRFGGLWFAPAPALAGLLLGHALWSWRRLEVNRRELILQMSNDRATLNAIGDAVVRTDLQGRVRYMNPIAEQLSSMPFESALQREFGEVFQTAGSEDRGRVQAVLEGALAQRSAPRSTQCTLRDRQGVLRSVQLTVGGVPDAKGQRAGLVVALTDMTAMVSLTQELAYQAMHDFLTRLPNRQLLMDRINQALHLASRTRELVAILFVDVDGFKRINDSLGHAGGDHVLHEVARRLSEARRAGDTVARWGGDEFVIVLEAMQRQAPIGTIARKTLARLSEALTYRGQEIFVTASIGIAVYPCDGSDADTLLRNADTAMYRVKRQTRNGFRFYSEEINRFTAQHLALEQAMRYAIRRGEFELYYQPQIQFATARIVGVEALIRWRHPESGLMLPGTFIPVAEEAGLIEEIGLWTLRQACLQVREWDAQGFGAVTVAINVSPRQMLRSGMVRSLERVLRESRVEPRSLKLEIVETAVMHDIERLEGVLKAVRALGVHVAIDDFGTGYSSLMHIKRFPVDEVKIDQTFVRGISDNANDAAITQAVIAMAHSMGLTVVAEGVENETQHEFLRERGCDEWQGFLFSRPVPAAELAIYLAAEQAKPDVVPRGMTM